MGLLAKRKTKGRMQPRPFRSTLPWDSVSEMFRATADETEPLVGILSKGQRPYHEVDDGAPTVSWGRPVPGKHKPFVVPRASWVVVLAPTSEGFTTTIVKAFTHNDEMSDFNRYRKFHDGFLDRLRTADPGLEELPQVDGRAGTRRAATR